MPTTCAPDSAILAVNCPGPQPISRTRSPGIGASSGKHIRSVSSIQTNGGPRKDRRSLLLVYRRQRTSAAGDKLFAASSMFTSARSRICAGRPIQGDSRTVVRAEGRNFGGLGLREITLRLNDEEDSRRAERVLLLFCVERLLLQDARLCAPDSRERDCCKPITRVLNIDADLFSSCRCRNSD